MPSIVMEEGEKEDSHDNVKAVVVVLATLRITTECEAHWQFGSSL